MFRRRLLSIVGAVGLVTGLLTSGVAAQADTAAGPDSTYNSMLAIFSWSSHDVCYSNGTFITPANPCVISQGGSRTNIAVCVQVTSPAQQCDITQANVSSNNYALVIQRINQQGTTASCPALPALPPPCQNATQRASILQDATTTGSNFGGVIQKVTQSLTEQATDGDPGQTNEQDVQSLLWNQPDGLKQTSGTGSNFAAVGQDSQQSQAGAIAQSQTATQSAGNSGSENGINQTTAAPGGNAAVLGQLQKQNLQSQVAKDQSEHAFQDGDITQTGGAGNFRNRASGNQFQDQQEHGVTGALGTSQVQVGDPRCCSTQIAGGLFPIVQVTNQFANNWALRNQTEYILGNCVSPPNGCTLRQSATVNGTTTPGDPCTAQPFCSKQIACNTEGGCVAGPPPSTLLLFSRPSLALRGRAVANAALLT
jgi:hypothetical protein